MNRMNGKVVLITGAGGGIGGASARVMAREGAQVILTDLATKAGEAIAHEIKGKFIKLDVTSEDEWSRVVAQVAAEYKAIDVLVNAAGIEGNIAAANPETTSYAEWKKVVSVNLDSVFLGCRAVLPIMRQKKAGSIVNISSIVSFFGSPNAAAYGASKAAVQQYSKSLALHGTRDGMRIRCNSVHPGVIRTRMLANIYTELGKIFGMTPEQVEISSLKAIPFGELGTPEQVADLILFLASDESSYITGSEFQVDGGWHLVEAK